MKPTQEEFLKVKKTGKVLQESSYESFKDIRSNILQVAQNELYDLFMFHASNVWFDYQAGPRKGKGGKTSSIIIYIYTRENPKEGKVLEDGWHLVGNGRRRSILPDDEASQ